MKNYIVTVNGVSYEVSVEEVEEGQAAAPAAAPVKATPVKAAAPAKKAKAGSVKVSAPMPGKIIAVKKDAGAAVKKGEVILVLEAMKMENEIVAPQDGTVASVNVGAGDAVEAGDVLATMN